MFESTRWVMVHNKIKKREFYCLIGGTYTILKSNKPSINNCIMVQNYKTINSIQFNKTLFQNKQIKSTETKKLFMKLVPTKTTHPCVGTS